MFRTPRKYIIAELSIRKLGCSSVLIIRLFEFTPKSRNYKERNVQSKKRKVNRSVIRQHSSVFRQHSSVIRHGCHVVSKCLKQRYFLPVLVTHFLYFRGGLPLLRALAKNMAAVRSITCAVTNTLRFFLSTCLSL